MQNKDKYQSLSSIYIADDLLDRLPENKRSGSIFIESDDIYLYTTWYTWSLLFFILVYSCWHMFFRMIKKEYYLEKDQ